MMYRSHAAMGIASGIMVSSYYNTDVPNTIICIGLGLIGSFIPDMDHRQSYISRRVPILPWLISSIFEHRGFTHSFLLMAMIFYGLMVSHVPAILSIAFITGILSHSVGDMFTVQGVKLLWPIPLRISLLPMRTGSKFETPVAFGLSAIGIGATNMPLVLPLFASLKTMLQV